MAKDIPPPKDVAEKVGRARESMQDGASRRNECLAFWRGDQYVHRDTDNYLVSQGTVSGSKPRHRPRTTRNLIHGLVEAKVSAASQRVPSYETTAATTDPEDISAARLSEKVAVFGYEKWQLRRVTRKVLTAAVVMDGGFAMPFWDSTAPPIIDEETGLGIGEVKVRTFTGNEVGWEPGLEFMDAPFHVVCQARLPEEISNTPGYILGKTELTPDSQTNDTLNTGRPANAKLVMVTEFFERPCAKYPKGRYIVMANDRVIFPIEDYPCAAYEYDGPVLHPLSYTVDPDSDRDRGLVVHLLDAQRAYNNATNQQISWAQLALNPQIIGPPMANKVKFTDEPGAYYTVIPINGMTPQWRDVPPIPPELSMMKEEAKRDMLEIAAANDIPNQVESGKGIQALIERDAARWQALLADIAAWHSSVMQHCLMLVQKYYTEPRLLKIRGRFGPELLEDFIGADLRSQVDVRVMPGSIEPRTREATEQRVMSYAQLGWIGPEAAMAAINGGNAEKLVESYELDVARANQMVQKIKAGPEILFAEPMVDPSQPPSWAPRKFDNLDVHMAIFADWLKTQDYDAAAPEVQEAARLYFDACEFLKAQKEMQAAMAQAQQAESLGMDNAAKPQSGTPDNPKPLPSQPKPGGPQ